MNNDQILSVIDSNLTGLAEAANNMHVGARSAVSFKPCLPQSDGFVSTVYLILNKQDLHVIVNSPESHEEGGDGTTRGLPFQPVDDHDDRYIGRL